MTSGNAALVTFYENGQSTLTIRTTNPTAENAKNVKKAKHW